jgi:lysophospholipase L1-like esterase
MPEPPIPNYFAPYIVGNSTNAPPNAQMFGTLTLNPTNFSGLLAWWDASRGRYQDLAASVPSPYGSPVGSWVSRDGSGSVAVAPSLSNRMSGYGNAGGIECPYGTGPTLICPGATSGNVLTTTINLVRPYTLIAVAAAGANGPSYRPVVVNNAAVSNQFVGTGSVAYLSGNVDSADPFAAGAGPRSTFILRSNVVGSDVWVNGIDGTTGGTHTADFGTLLFNGFGSGSIGIQHIAAFNRVLSDAECTAITTYFQTPSLNLVCDGNSLMVGFTVGTNSAPPVLLANTLATSDPFAWIANTGISGETTTQLIALASANVDPKYNPLASSNVCLLWEITNDIAVGGVTQTVAYNDYVTYANARKAAHPWKVILCDSMPRTGTVYSTTSSLLAADFGVATRNPYVFLPNSGITYADMLIKMSTVPQLTNSSNTTYFYADGIHLTALGYQIVANTFRDGLAILGSGVAPVLPKLALEIHGHSAADITSGTLPSGVILAGRARNTATRTNATVTMAALADLTLNLAVGQKVFGRLVVYANNSTAAEGLAFDFNGGTATMTSFEAAFACVPPGSGLALGTLTTTALATALTITTATTGDAVYTIEFAFVANAAGTFIPRFAEVSHTSGTATVQLGSFITFDTSPN